MRRFKRDRGARSPLPGTPAPRIFPVPGPMSPAGVEPEGRLLRPSEILELEPADADRLLDQLESDVPSHRGVVDLDVPGATEAVIFADTHGDWRSTEAVAARFLLEPAERILVGLGDYVDRAPDDCGEGSVANALFLLSLAARFPERVCLIRGNHELNQQIPVLPHDLPEELDALWGPDPDRYARLNALLDRGPLAALTGSGGYFAHAGFLQDAEPTWRGRLDRPSEDDLVALAWSECAESRIQRGVPRFTTTELARFLRTAGASLFVRGHDPDLNGRWSCGDRCLTLHTSRVFERYGGVLAARLDLTVRAGPASLRVEHLETEGTEFDPP